MSNQNANGQSGQALVGFVAILAILGAVLTQSVQFHSKDHKTQQTRVFSERQAASLTEVVNLTNYISKGGSTRFSPLNTETIQSTQTSLVQMQNNFMSGLSLSPTPYQEETTYPAGTPFNLATTAAYAPGLSVNPTYNGNNLSATVPPDVNSSALCSEMSFPTGTNARCLVAGAKSGATQPDFGPPVIPTGIAIQADGKIVLSGNISLPSGKSLFIARFNTDGSVDDSFGTSGHVIDWTGASSSTTVGLAIRPSGKIVFGGQIVNSSGTTGYLAQLDSGGSVDLSFGNAGIFYPNIPNFLPNTLALQSDGQIILAGQQRLVNFTFQNMTYAGFNIGALMRVLADGSGLDASFGGANNSGGEYILYPYTFLPGGITGVPNSYIVSVVVSPVTGAIVLAGGTTADPRAVWCTSMAYWDNFYVRLNPDGSFDNTFGSGGSFVWFMGNEWNTPLNIALDSNQNIYTSNLVSWVPSTCSPPYTFPPPSSHHFRAHELRSSFGYLWNEWPCGVGSRLVRVSVCFRVF